MLLQFAVMGKLNLYIANANQKFTNSEIATIKKAASSAQKFIANNFVFDYTVDLIVTAPSFLMNTIPEDGIGGRTYSSHFVAIALNKHEREINEDIVFETICHEMSHSLRWEKLPEYSKTLFDGMILEGLAVVLEEKAMNDTNRKQRQFFLEEVQKTNQATIHNIISQLSSHMNSKHYNYDTIFYAGNDSLPRWAGYKLGYYYVKKYLQKTNSTIFEATLASYSSFSPDV